MSNKLFSGMPSINIPRSRWNDDYNITSSFKHGYFVPVDFIPILPGDGLSLSLKDITRLQTPLAPIYGNIKQYFAAWFVPWRLLWENVEEFFGANKTSAGYQVLSYLLPHAKFMHCDVGSLSHYLGKPLKGLVETDADGKYYYVANMLKERAYYVIWNEYMRAQQITNPVLVNKGDSDDNYTADSVIGYYNGVAIDPGANTSLLRVAKEFDYFTASTLSPQYGAAVELPLGTTAPLTVGSIYSPGNIGFSSSGLTYGQDDFFHLGTVDEGGPDSKYLEAKTTAESVLQASRAVIDETNLYVDLSTATAAKVNDVRYAFAVQKYLERANFAGNYFFGILQVHYGVTSPDSRLQRPEFLGEFSEDILVHQVVSTADTTNSGIKTSVGNTGAMSVTASGAINLFNKAFVEPGFVCLLRWCRHRQVYAQGVMREDFKKDRFEIYTPELCNLGDQATLTRELYWKAGESSIFGAQEHWAEYRYRPDRCTGLFDPTGGSSTFTFWTLANNFTTKPQLNDDFIMERRDELDRALTTGSAYDEYLSDTWIDCTWTREMPVRTIPGLIDHFGAM